MPTLRFPLYGSITNRNPNAAISDTKDQFFTNCVPELLKNELTGKQDIWLNKRQGTTASSDVQANATGHFGAVRWTSNSAATPPVIFSYIKSTGSSVMFFSAAGGQIGGDIANTGACLFMDETEISGTGNLTATLIDNPGNGWEVWYFPEGGAWTQITDGDFPTNLTASHAHMDGYMFVMTDDGKIFNSDLNSLSAWTAANFITANSFGDNGIGCVRYRNFIVGFGDYSTEFFYNAGNSVGSILSRVDNATLRIGALRTGQAAGPSMRAVGNTVYWIGTDAGSGAGGIYRLNGMVAEKISTPAVDKLIANGEVTYTLGSFSLLGMTHVAFQVGTGSALCYCVEMKFWWIFTPAGSLSLTAFVGGADSNPFRKAYFNTFSNAKIYTFDPNSPVWQDNSSAYTMTVQTDNIDADTDRMKFWDRIGVTYDRQGSASNLGISWSDDDYANFSTAQNIDMSTDQSWLTALGASRRRAWKLTHSANTACRIKAVEIDYELGLS